jgi:hypothetical protein
MCLIGSLILLARCLLPLNRTNILGPGALDEGQNGRYFLFGQCFTEGGHVATPADIIRQAGAAQLNRFNKNSVAMVPGVTTGIVGWGSERVVFVLLLPIRFSLKVYPMTLGAIFCIHILPQGYLFWVKIWQRGDF